MSKAVYIIDCCPIKIKKIYSRSSTIKWK